MGKNPPANGEDSFNPWVRKFPWRRKWQPTPVFLPGESHRQRSLAGRATVNRVTKNPTQQKSNNIQNIPDNCILIFIFLLLILVTYLAATQFVKNFFLLLTTTQVILQIFFGEIFQIPFGKRHHYYNFAFFASSIVTTPPPGFPAFPFTLILS